MILNRSTDEHCEEVRILLDAYLDSELGPDTASWVLQHLASCPSCEADRIARVESKAALKAGVERIEPDAGFEHVLRRRLREEAKPKPFKGLGQLALAASILIALLAGWHWTQAPSVPASPSEARAAQDADINSLFRLVSHATRPGLGDHLHCAHYRKFGSALPSFEEMVEKLGPDYQDVLLIAKRAAPQGFQVVLGHRCKYRDRAFVHVALRKDEELLSVILTDRRPEESFELDGLVPALRSETGLDLYSQSAVQFQVASFETSHHLAYVVSNLERAANTAIAAALAPELGDLLKQLEG